MCKKSCSDCKNYKWKETKVVGHKPVCGGMALIPITKVIPSHCDVHPRYFKKWWKENGGKRRTDEDYVEPRCYEPTEFAKQTQGMIDLMNEILEKVEKENGK